MEIRLLESFLKSACRTGKVSFGVRETLKYIKGAKLVITSQSLKQDEKDALLNSCSALSVPLIQFEGSSIQLGNIAGVKHPVKAIGIRSTGEADLNKLLNVAKSSSSQKI